LQRQAAALTPADPLERKRQQLRESVTAANKQLKRLKDAGLYDFSAAAKSVLGLADDLGRTSAGYLATSGKRFENLSEAQIDKYLEVLDRKKKQRSYTVEGATAEAERLANNFGTTAQRIIDLADGMPLFFNILKNLAKNETSDKVREEIDAFDDPDATAEDFLQQMLNISNTRSLLNAITDTFGGDDFYMLDKFLPVREDLAALAEAYSVNPDGLDDTVETVRNYIANSLYVDDVTDVLDYIRDDIQEALRGR
jgi:CRISPR/Cas system CSM-associated protein Csm2 small subunit